jgi:hypothetical protein
MSHEFLWLIMLFSPVPLITQPPIHWVLDGGSVPRGK